MKICTKCKEIKELRAFGKNKNRKDGLHYQCKECRKKYNEENKKERTVYDRKYYKDNEEKIKKKTKKFRNENKEEIIARKKRHYEKNKGAIIVKTKRYREENKEKLAERKKKYNKEHKREIAKNIKNRYKTDPLYKTICLTKSLVRGSFKNQGFKKISKTAQILDCTFNYFYNHLTWSFIKNYNRLPTKDDILNIDHIIPISTAKTQQDTIKLCHYTNLQWLLEKDNLEKSDKLDWKLK